MSATSSPNRAMYTGGPWEWLPLSQMGAMDGAQIRTVASTQHTSALSGPTYIAAVYDRVDGPLIAAAPDLYEALRLFDCGCRVNVTVACGTCYGCVARAAIAKAEGRQ